MKKAILYYSVYGTTKQYAIWANEALNYDILDLQKINKDHLVDYDELIIFSNVMHNQLSAMSLLKKHKDIIRDKISLIVCCSFQTSTLVQSKIQDVLSDDIPIIFIPGAFHQDLKYVDFLNTYRHFLYYRKHKVIKTSLQYGRNNIDKTCIDPIIQLAKTN